ncbi:SDR family oxidoreductase [Micromonospora radicis]|uniref:SDR family oxidoreductase n=1 Tax=Micromonospora radicis TaxID=1894971 RepID=A0A418N132_9ACTN|nr:SDR family oxidoreductase [Micromonospora radicis]RIV41542.1 SDR family oxidoreductase [Micromonospora radicis]
MHPPILVTGGTGTIGRLVIPLLGAAGHPVRSLSRRGGADSPGVEQVVADLATGAGVDATVRDVEVVLHLAGGRQGDDQLARTLARAARRADVRQLVFVSVTGADRVPLAWLRTKLAAEQAVADSGVPWTTLRAGQLHELTLTLVRKLAALPVVPVPGGMRLEPVDGREVAARLVELTLAAPAGLVPDLAGPQVYELGELVRGYLRATDRRRLLVPVRIPGRAGRAYRAGANLARRGATRGTRAWTEFLAEQVRPATADTR